MARRCAGAAGVCVRRLLQQAPRGPRPPPATAAAALAAGGTGARPEAESPGSATWTGKIECSGTGLSRPRRQDGPPQCLNTQKDREHTRV